MSIQVSERMTASPPQSLVSAANSAGTVNHSSVAGSGNKQQSATTVTAKTPFSIENILCQNLHNNNNNNSNNHNSSGKVKTTIAKCAKNNCDSEKFKHQQLSQEQQHHQKHSPRQALDDTEEYMRLVAQQR